MLILNDFAEKNHIKKAVLTDEHPKKINESEFPVQIVVSVGVMRIIGRRLR